jgi:hypothetical protein
MERSACGRVSDVIQAEEAYMDKEHIEGPIEDAADRMNDDHKLPPDSKMEKAVDQAQATGGGAKDTLRQASAMKDAGMLYNTPKP